MEKLLPYLVVFGVVVVFAAIVYGMVVSSKKSKQKKVDAAQSLGFRALEPDAGLTERIVQLYRTQRQSGRYELQNVFYKFNGNGECYLFDLVSHSDDDTSYPEQQAVAIFSTQIDLPRFSVFPRADVSGPVAKLANQAVTWLISKFEQPVDCSAYPEFDRRYLLSSPNPVEAQRFFSPELFDHLAQTRMYTVKAAGDGFLFSTMETGSGPLTSERTALRVRSALDMLDALIKWGGDASPKP